MIQYEIDLKEDAQLIEVAKILAVADYYLVMKDYSDVGFAYRLIVQTKIRIEGLDDFVVVMNTKAPVRVITFKPIVDKGNLVLAYATAAPSRDMDDYISLPLATGAGGLSTYKFYLGISKSTHTDFYTPFDQISHVVLAGVNGGGMGV